MMCLTFLLVHLGPRLRSWAAQGGPRSEPAGLAATAATTEADQGQLNHSPIAFTWLISRWLENYAGSDRGLPVAADDRRLELAS